MNNKFKPNNYFYLLLTLVALFAVPQLMAEHSDSRYSNRNNSSIVDIDIVNDYGRQYKQYAINSNQYKVERAYLEAKDGKSYGIKVRNNSSQRIGLVIAVDGRNIISGKQSNLKANERMYILNPYQKSTYKGWRSTRNRVNEFYFTDVPDSYADRTFGDRTAMGVIAVAVFKEKNGRWYQENERRYDDFSSDRDNKSKSPSLKNRDSRSAPQSKGQAEAYQDSDNEPGTGYGEDRYSPTRRVEFKAQRNAEVKHFIKYEWKATLCEMGITNCGKRGRDKNRFWSSRDNGQYAPPPPVRRYRYFKKAIG